MTNNIKHQKNRQPVKKFFRADPLVFMFLVEHKLKAPHVTFLLYFMLAMDRENIFETREGLAEHMSNRFGIRKNHVSSHLKYMRELNIFVPLDHPIWPKAIRINPYIVNKVQNLTGFWEFEDIKLGAISEDYSKWLFEQSLPKDLPSYVRLKKGEIVMEKRLEKYILRTKHEQIVRDLTAEIDRLVQEYTKSYETFIAEREERDMRLEQLEEALKHKTDIVDRIDLKMDAILAELRKYNPEKADEFEEEKKQRHLRVVKSDEYQALH